MVEKNYQTDGTYVNRRNVMKTAGGASILGLAGCLGMGDGGDGGGDGGDGGGDGGGATPTPSTGGSDYPSEPITVIVPFGAGGGTDTQMRAFQPYLEEELGVSLVIENRSGASGRVGTEALYDSEPDGYTIEIISLPTSVIGQVAFDPDYDVNEMVTLGTVSASYFGWQSNPDEGFENLEDLMDWAGEEPRQIGSVGVGSSGHFGMVSFLIMFDVEDWTDVPYESGQETSTAVASGEVLAGYGGTGSMKGLYDDDRLDVLFIDRPTESPLFPDVPTQEDTDLDTPGVALETGMYGPPGFPEDARDVISEAIVAAAQNEDYIADAEEAGLSPVGADWQETRDKVNNYFELGEAYVERVDIEG